LAQQGYNVKTLAELLNPRPAEIRAFLQSQLPPGRAEELKQQLLGTGIPLWNKAFSFSVNMSRARCY
jgi:hypothetical protein